MSDRFEHTQVPDVTGTGGILITKPNATTINVAGAGGGSFGVLQGLNHYTKASDIDNIIVLPGAALASVGAGIITLGSALDTDTDTLAVTGTGGRIGPINSGNWRGLYVIGDSTLTNPTIIVNKEVAGGVFVDPTVGELAGLGYDQSARIGSFFWDLGAFRNSHSIREFVRNGDQVVYTNSADSLVRWFSTDLSNPIPTTAPGVTALETGAGDNLTGVLTTSFATLIVNFSNFIPPGLLAANVFFVIDQDDFLITATPGDSGLTTTGGQLVMLYQDTGAPDHTLSLEKSIALSASQDARFRFQTIAGTGDTDELGIYVNEYVDKV